MCLTLLNLARKPGVSCSVIDLDVNLYIEPANILVIIAVCQKFLYEQRFWMFSVNIHLIMGVSYQIMGIFANLYN